MSDYLEANPQGSISCRHSVVCFHFPFSVSVHQLVSVTAPVSIVSEHWLKAGFEHKCFYFGVFLFCPHDPPGGPPWSLSHSYACPWVHSRKKHGSVTHNPPCFSFPTARICVPCGYTFWKEITISCFGKREVPKTYCSQGEVVSMDVSSIWGCFAANVSWEETRQGTYW